MADALVSILLEQLVSIIRQELQQEVRLVVGVRQDIQQMSTTLKSIQTVLDDAEENQFKNKAVKIWLDQLKNAAYDMEDVLEEWSTEILKSELEGVDNAQIPKKKVCSYMFSLCNCFGQVYLRQDIGHKIKELKERLDVIAIEKDKYNLNATRRTEEPSRRMTSSVIDVLEVCGRTQDKDTLLSKLLSESSRQEIDVPVISIVGLGGMGKTTLAQIIYNDDSVKNYFEKRMWICVSEPFDQIRLAKAIIKAIGENVPDDIEWDSLHQHLCNVIRGKRFLLVLDDVWTEDRTMWSPLKYSLNGGAQGSRIVVTTRNNGVTKMISSTYTHDLARLSMEDCWLIFSRIAFQGRREEDCEKLEEIGKEITKKCRGVPLFAKTLGGLMLFKSTRLEWQQVLDSDTWKLADVEKDVLPALLLSYYALPSQVKRCFAYCSTFPKDSEIYKDDLIKLWMAQGFLSTTGRPDLEVVGAECFDNLAMRSFFQDFRHDGDGNIIYYKMHDLVHDFAQFLTDTECSIINGDNPKLNISEIVRHLNVQNMDSDSTLPSIYKVKNLRTLIIDVGAWAPLQIPALSDLFCRLTCLRALSFYGIQNLEELPNGVEKLIHLKYFDLSKTRLKELPETMSKLFNLQTLRLKECWRLCKLPEGIGKMINLRHLEIEGTNNLNYMPQGIGKLNSLRTLHKFVVGSVSGGGCRIGELEDLKLLQGDLEISGLERLSNENEASATAKLKDKQYLHGLALKFENVAEGEIEKMECVLEGLQPHRNLEKLKIIGYPGSKFPCWMVDSMLPNLLTIKLSYCNKFVQFPPLGRFPYLQNLEITYMDGIIKFTRKDFGGIVGNDGFVKVFPKLKKLYVGYMANLEEWDFRGEDGEINMPRLSILRLLGFPKLKVLPAVGNLSVLVELGIAGMDSVKRVGLEFLGIVEVGGKKGIDHTVVVFPHLERLRFLDMTKWEEWEMLESEFVVIMPRLQVLSLSNCPKLKKLPHQIFPATLRKLYISKCPKLNWTPCLPPHLEELVLSGDVGVLSRSLPIDGTSNHLKTLNIIDSEHSSLPEGLARLTSLQHLEMSFSNSLKCMPEELHHLTSIQQLVIFDCPLLERRCRKEIGEDWSIISHIPHIYIDDEIICSVRG